MPRIRAATIDEHKTLIRSALLGSARQLIEHAGTANVPLGEVAFLAGVGRTTFYDYFSDRDDVIASLVEEELPGVLAGLIDSVPADLAPEERLVVLARHTVEFVATDRVLGVILHREVGSMGPNAQTRIKDAHARLSSEMARVYYEGVSHGVFRRLPPALAGALIQDTIMSAARVLIGEAASLQEVLDGVEAFLTGGLLTAR